MPSVLINKDTGLAESLPDESIQPYLQAGTHEYPLVDQQGNNFTAPADKVNDFIKQGYSQPNDEQTQGLLKYAKYSSIPEQIKTGLEGAGVANTFGLSTLAEKALGATDEGINARKEVNPGTHAAGEVGGLLASSLIPGVGEAELLSKAGELAKGYTGLKEAGLLSRFGAGAAKIGTESALMGAGDEMSKFISNEPGQSSESALTNIGLSGLIGAGTGGAFGTISPLWEAANGSKVGQFIQDFKTQWMNRVENPEPVQALTNELKGVVDGASKLADETYGATGLKARAIAQHLPETNEKILGQASDLVTKAENAIANLGSDKNAGILMPELAKLKNAITPEIDKATGEIISQPKSADIFDATQRFKQVLGEYSDFNSIIPAPVADRSFVKMSGQLYHDFRIALESPEVWGKAGEAQQQLNSAFSKYNPALKDFKGKFLAKELGENVVNPAKVLTYYNQLGKGNAEIKQSAMKNFLDATDNYLESVNKVHASMGLDPVEPWSTGNLRASTNKITGGAKLANYVADKGVAKLAGEGVGTAIGAGIGHMVGHPAVGAIVGERALSPFFSHILPAIAKPIMDMPVYSKALKAAADLGSSIVKGDGLIRNASKSIFNAAEDVIPRKLIPDANSRDKLKNKLDKIKDDQASLLNVGGDIGHYMPNHASNLGSVAARTTQYIQSLKPTTDKLSPLEPNRKPASSEEATYDRQLDIAEQPLLTLKHLKEGTLIPQDIVTLKTCYPGLYSNISNKLTEELINHTSEGNTVPYKTRLGLSLFLGESMDSTMSPQAIAAAQPKPLGQAPQQGQPKGHSESMKDIGKIADLYQTPNQARQSDRLKS